MSDMTMLSGDDAPAPNDRSVTISAAAAQRIAELAKAQGDPSLMLRVSVFGGGCSGFQYSFSFDDTVRDDDLTFARDGAAVIIDDVSLGLLSGAEIDFVQELIGSSFQIKNPNATSSCGCGSSFAV